MEAQAALADARSENAVLRASLAKAAAEVPLDPARPLPLAAAAAQCV
jgi:hypothetical protein